MEECGLIKEDTVVTGGSQPNSRASSSDQEFDVTEFSTALSPEVSNPMEPSRPESSAEYLMTAQEIQELDNRLEEVVDKLQKQKDDYEQWESNLNKRRLEAYGRLKALGKFHRQRMEVYETVKDYLQTMSTGRISRTTKKKSK